MYRLAIIGVTGFGNVHFNDIKALVESGQAKCVAAAIVNPDEAEEQIEWLTHAGATIYPDYKQMLQGHHGKIDLCFIPTGIHMHAPMTKAALEAGANVFVEKPAAALLKDVRSMHTASRAALKFVAVGYQSTYVPEVHELKKRLAAGDFGRVIRLKCRGLWPRSDKYYGRNNWAGKIRSGDDWVLDSPFNNALAHYINLMLFIAGRGPDEAALPITVQSELYRANDIESADTAAIRVQLAGNQEILFYVTHASEEAFGPEIIIETDICQITWANSDWVVSYHDESKDGEVFTKTPTEEVREKLRESVIGRLRDANSFIYGLDMAIMQTMVANAAHDSSEIHEIPEALVSTKKGDGETFTVIKGIDDLIANAFASNKLFSELGIEWAEEGRVIDTRDYHGLRAAEPALAGGYR